MATLNYAAKAESNGNGRDDVERQEMQQCRLVCTYLTPLVTNLVCTCKVPHLAAVTNYTFLPESYLPHHC